MGHTSVMLECGRKFVLVESPLQKISVVYIARLWVAALNSKYSKPFVTKISVGV